MFFNDTQHTILLRVHDWVVEMAYLNPHRINDRNCALSAYNFGVSQQIILKIVSTKVQYTGCLLCKL